MKNNKGFIGLLVLILMVSAYNPQRAEAAYYKDVSESYWAYDDIVFMTDNKVIQGFTDNTFRAGTRITRKNAAVMMVRALQVTEKGGSPWEVTDVKSYSPGYKEISLALSHGWFSTYEGRFMPSDILTRDEMAKALSKAFGFKGDGTSSFTDIPPSHRYYKYVDAIMRYEVTEGYADNTYRPKAATTRAQFTAFLSRIYSQPLQYEIKLDGVTKGTASHFDDAVALSSQIGLSSIHPVSNRYRTFAQEIGTADKTGIEAGALIYNGVGEIDSFTPEFYDPYLSYQTMTGGNQSMFETFIILALRYDGGRFSHTESNDANYADWREHINRTFAADGALNSLNEAAKLHNQKANVYVSIPYPKRVNDFILPDGSRQANSYDSRYAIVKWYISEVRKELQTANFQNLNFQGFYWTNETIGVKEDEELIRAASQIAHGSGDYLIYSPHALSTNFEKWQTYGLDAAFLQPNAFRASVEGKDRRLHDAFVKAQMYGSGITIEIDSYGAAQAEMGVDAFNLYMDYSKRYNLDDEHMVMYQGTNMVSRMKYYENAIFNTWYDQLINTFFPHSL